MQLLIAMSLTLSTRMHQSPYSAFLNGTLDAFDRKFHRSYDFNNLSGASRLTHYDCYQVEVSANGKYRFEMASKRDRTLGLDTFLYLYRGKFDPNLSRSNLIAFDDDFGGEYTKRLNGSFLTFLTQFQPEWSIGQNCFASGFSAELNSKERYFLVATSFSDLASGEYYLGIEGSTSFNVLAQK